MHIFGFFTSPSMKQTVCHEIPLFGSKSSRWFITNWVDAEKSAFLHERDAVFSHIYYFLFILNLVELVRDVPS